MVVNEPEKAAGVKRACRLQEPKPILSVGGFQSRSRGMWNRKVVNGESRYFI